jgi:AAA+ ATPase superfamily predicted ATPase
LGDNVAELVLDPGGRLVDEAQHMLDAFAPNADLHYAIVEAIASGDRTWSRITSRVGKSGGSVSRPMEWLEQMEIIERVVPITEKKPARSKRVVYRIRDPYIAFWHTVIAPLHRSGTIGLADPAEIWRELVEPRLDDHMGKVFEKICREWVAHHKLPFTPVRLGSWWDAKSRNEVDVAALSAADELFVAECKWGAVTGDHLARLRERSQLVAREFPHISSIRLGLFTGRGEADDVVREAQERGEVELIGPERLLV